MKGESEKDYTSVPGGTKRGGGEKREATEQRKTERRRGGRFGLTVVARGAGQGGERETRV